MTEARGPGAPRFRTGIASALVAILTGCGDTQAGTVPTFTSAQNEAHQRSGSSGDLLYIASSNTDEVYIATYPGGTILNTFKTAARPMSICSDANGNVWVPEKDYSSGPASVVEYAHGGTTPIATLSLGNEYPQECAVDPTTGNLAVVDYDANVALFENAQGQPTYYSSVGVVGIPQLVTYDSAGNLFLTARRMDNYGWLPHGGNAIERSHIKSNKPRQGLRWDGKYLTLMTDVAVSRYRLNGSRGKKVGTVGPFPACVGRYWITNGTGLVCTNYPEGTASIYNYRSASHITTIAGLSSPWGITVSVAPTASHK